MNNNEKKTMTLFELENYINSKSNKRLIYTHENNDFDSIRIKIIFDAITVSHLTYRIVFWDTSKGRATENNSNYLLIACIDKITVEHLLSTSDVITITASYPHSKMKYVILFDYENQ